MQRVRRRFALKTPTASRSLAFGALGLSLLSGAATAAAREITEADVIQLALERAPSSAVAAATIRLADARRETAGPLPNPVLGWERESLLTGDDSAQDVFRVTIPVDLVRARAERSLTASESSWMRAEAARARTDAVLEAVFVYYDLVVAERRAEILDEAVTSLSEAARVLARREEEGAVSGYETTRLALASELARSLRAEARGALAGLREHLARLLGIETENVRVDGKLTLSAIPGRKELERAGEENREDLRAARDSSRRAEEAEDRAAWTWFPMLGVTGGANVVREIDTRRGYVLGVSLDVPLFERGQALRAEASARRALASAQADAWLRSLRIEIAAAHASYTSARAELERFERATASAVESLLDAARAGYREGERSIVELLDAQRARTEVAERRLELLAGAKRAEARLRAASGSLR